MPVSTSPLRLRTVLTGLAVTVGVGLLTGWLVYRWHHPAGGDRYALAGSLLAGISYTGIMGGLQYAVGRWMRTRVPLQSKQAVGVHVGVLSVTTVVSFFLATGLLKLFFGPFFEGEFVGIVVVAVVAFTASLVCNTVFYLVSFYQRLRAMERTALEAELRALRAQINPHFLFNSLNTIASLIRLRPAEAEAVTEDLADLFRYSLRASQHPTVSLAEELASVELFLGIERARYPDRLRVVRDVPEALLRAQLPSLTLQPLVENAVKHGAGATLAPFTLTLEGRLEDDLVVLEIRDTGPGFDTADEAAVYARGTGLVNVRDRLRLLFGPAGRLVLRPDGVSLQFPFQPVPAPRPVPERAATPS